MTLATLVLVSSLAVLAQEPSNAPPTAELSKARERSVIELSNVGEGESAALYSLFQAADELATGTPVYIEATHRCVRSLDGAGRLVDNAGLLKPHDLMGRLAVGPVVIVTSAGAGILRQQEEGHTIDLAGDKIGPVKIEHSLQGGTACVALNSNGTVLAIVGHGEDDIRGTVFSLKGDSFHVLAERTFTPERPGVRPGPILLMGVRFDMNGKAVWAHARSGQAFDLMSDRTHSFPKSMFGGSALSDFCFDSKRSEVFWFEADFGRLAVSKIGSKKGTEVSNAGSGTMGQPDGWIDLTLQWVALSGNDSREHGLFDRASAKKRSSLGSGFTIPFVDRVRGTIGLASATTLAVAPEAGADVRVRSL